MAFGRINLAEWMREAFLDKERGGPCTAFALMHLANGAVEEEIYSKQLADKIGTDEIAELAEVMRHKAATYAGGLSGAQQFILFAFYADSKMPGAKYPFVEKGYTEMSDGMMTEGPSVKGHMQQMMRHNEGILARAFAKDEHVSNVLLKTLEYKHKETEALKTENIQLLTLVKDMLMREADNRHAHRMKEIEAENAAKFKAELMKWAPLLLNAATGREIIPQTATDTQLVESIIDAMEGKGPEALAMIQGLKLPPAILASFADRFQKGIELRMKERQARETTDLAEYPGKDGLQ